MSETPILELKNISKNFRTIQALDHVDFDLREGEVHALVGENGAGKSTLMRILAGIYTDYEGTYTLDGKEIHLHTPGAALEHGIGMIHQELSTIPPLSVAENLFLGRQPVTRLGAIDWGKCAASRRNSFIRWASTSTPRCRWNCTRWAHSRSWKCCVRSCLARAC